MDTGGGGGGGGGGGAASVCYSDGGDYLHDDQDDTMNVHDHHQQQAHHNHNHHHQQQQHQHHHQSGCQNSGQSSQAANSSTSGSSGIGSGSSTNAHLPKARIVKRSWSELKTSVSELRRNLASLASMVPSNINFRTLSDGRTRIYFLGTPPNGWETTLMYADIGPETAEATSKKTNGRADRKRLNEEGATNCETGEKDERFAGATGVLEDDADRQEDDGEDDDDDDDDNEEMPEHKPMKKLHWGLLLELALPNMDVYGILPPVREVQLLLERKRLSMLGISSYEMHHASGKIVFPLSSRLYQCQDTGYDVSVVRGDYGYRKLLVPNEVRCTKLWAALDPQICPDNSDLIAHVSGGDICISHSLSGQSERVTFAHDGRRSFADDPLSAGTPAYVMQEEFSRYQGYWWQPKSQDGIYRFVYEEVDESDVNLFTFPSSQAEGGGEFEEYRFPRAGTPNARSKLKLAQFRLSETMRITDIRLLDMQQQLEHSCPWVEYIVRVGWTPDGQHVWVQALNRRQQRLELILIPLAYFCDQCGGSGGADSSAAASDRGGSMSPPPPQPAHSPLPTAPAAAATSSPPPSLPSPLSAEEDRHCWRTSPLRKPAPPLQVICSQRSKKWVNVHNVLEFLEVSASAVTFLWAAEETGYRHLYLITASLLPATPSSADDDGSSEAADRLPHCFLPADLAPANLVARIESRVALTAGDWEVLGDAVWLDQPRQLVYFMGLRETPLERHLYVVSLRRPGEVRLLTAPGASYAVEFNAERTIMMQTFCSIRRQPSCCVVRVVHPVGDAQGDGSVSDVHSLRLVAVGTLIEGTAPADVAHCPAIYRPPLASGDQAYAMVFRPHNYRVGWRYPVVLNVYGGPEVQTVNNTFKGMRQLRMHMLAAQGYCVVCIDARGSWHRGMQFESYLHRRMGQVELADQVEALRWLAAELGYLDMDRVAIHGWSYGGYLSLMGLVQHPDVFRVAVAGAPVTDWEYYDTGYTERYMDLPVHNKEGYAAGSVLTHVPRFPDEDNRLLIIHGLIDENVHFFHTSQLVQQLVKHNKPYQLQVYPGERHSLRNLEASKHYETKLLSFLQNNL